MVAERTEQEQPEADSGDIGGEHELRLRGIAAKRLGQVGHGRQHEVGTGEPEHRPGDDEAQRQERDAAGARLAHGPARALRR